MTFEKAFIPYGAYWSTPFSRWQGSFASQHSVKLAAQVATDVLVDRGIDASAIEGLVLGTTVPQADAFYGAPWMAGMIGASSVTGPTVAQACATSARVLVNAAFEVEVGGLQSVLGVTCDRTSNGPHIYYPDGNAPGGRGRSTDWVWDAFSRDPLAKNAMIETAERVAAESGFTREQQDEIALLRFAQYQDSLADDRAFQRKYMAPVRLMRGKREVGKVVADEGIHESTAEGLAKLRPVQKDGTVTFGAQTHPADGNAGIFVASRERAAELSRDAKVSVQLVSYAEARTDLGMMPKAVVPAAVKALERAGLAIGDCKAIKTHNPFAVNDLYFSQQLGIKPEDMNRYGSPLVYGHPQAPTGTRLIIELIEELVQTGGGHGLFSGCAAGDTAMAVVIKVG